MRLRLIILLPKLYSHRGATGSDCNLLYAVRCCLLFIIEALKRKTIFNHSSDFHFFSSLHFHLKIITSTTWTVRKCVFLCISAELMVYLYQFCIKFFFSNNQPTNKQNSHQFFLCRHNFSFPISRVSRTVRSLYICDNTKAQKVDFHGRGGGSASFPVHLQMDTHSPLSGQIDDAKLFEFHAKRLRTDFSF